MPAVRPRRKRPHYKLEQELQQQGHLRVIGIDEVGRGSLAGPVVAAAVLLPGKARLGRVRDSKLLSAAQRQELARVIRRQAIAIGIGWVSHHEINQHGLTWAVGASGQRALADLGCAYDAVILDGNHNYLQQHCFSRAIIKADQICLSVASASIIAKVARDQYMQQQYRLYPEFDFHLHKGYATAGHLRQLQQQVSPIHRRNYLPVKLALGGVD